MQEVSNLTAILAFAAVVLTPVTVGAQSTTYGPTDTEAPAPEISFVPEGIPYPLVEAVSVAARDHPLIRRAMAERRAREANLRGARWQQFPSLTVEGLAVTQGNQIGAQNGLAGNLILEQPLYTFGRIGGAIKAADAAFEASGYSLTDTQIEIALRTVAAYYDLALATRREDLLRMSLEQHQSLLETIRNRVNQEVSPQADLELASSRVAQIEQDLAAVAGARSTSFSRLQELIGYADVDLGTVPRLRPELELPSEAEVVAAALECNPRIKALRARQREREAQRRVSRSQLFPQILAQASTNEITGARVGVAVRLQTGNGLSQFAAVDAAEADIIAAEFETGAAERDIREQIRVDYLTYVAGRDRVAASGRATRSSQLVTESYRRQFIAGRRTWLDVMNAVRESMSANLTEADAELGALAAYTRLMVRGCYWKTPPLVLNEE